MVWFLDISKQGSGQLLAHGANIVLGLEMGKGGAASECAWYIVGFTVDSFVGTMASWLFLLLLQFIVRRARCCPSLYVSGYYGDAAKPSYMLWFKQLLSWCVISLLARGLSASLVYLTRGSTGALAEQVDKLFKGDPKLELLCVMIVGPGVLNLFQFWILDTIIKLKKRRSGSEGREMTPSTSTNYGSDFDWNGNVQANTVGYDDSYVEMPDDTAKSSSKTALGGGRVTGVQKLRNTIAKQTGRPKKSGRRNLNIH